MFKKFLLFFIFYPFVASTITIGQELSFVITMESKSLKEPMVMEMFIKKTKTLLVPKQSVANGEVKILFDYNTKSQTTLINSNGQLIGMVASINNIEEVYETDKKLPEIQSTGNTKIIDGFNCNEYLVEYNNTSSNIWTTKEIEYGFSDVFKSMLSFSGPKGKDLDFVKGHKGVEGFPLEMNSRNKKTKEEFNVLINQISTSTIDENLFSTEGYQMVDASTIMKNGK